jgi:predicted permease
MTAGLRTTSSTGERERTWGWRVVVALQVALCLLLLVGTGLLVRSLRNLERIPLGLRADGLLVFGISPLRAQSHQETVRFYQGLLDRVRGLPGVEAVTVMENRIGSHWSNNTGGFVDGKSPTPDARGGRMRWNSVGPDYFRTLGIPLLYGRDILDSDAPDAPKVVVVNQTFVRKYLAGQAPLGHGVGMSADSTHYQIVGVAADSKYTGVREDPIPTAYYPYQQLPHVSAMHVEVRTAGDSAAFLPAVQRALRDLAPDLPLEQPRTQRQEFDRNFADNRLFARLAELFGLLAVVLVSIGLYGTLAYAVSRRTPEIGVRMALGAGRRTVLWMVLRESLFVAGAGIALGVPLAMAGARLLRSSLYGVGPGDPLTLALALAGLVVVALAASLMPAYRATAVDPMVALRAE